MIPPAFMGLHMSMKDVYKRVAIMSLSTLLIGTLVALQPIREFAYAATCTPFSHCYALEHEDGLTNYGNKFTTIVSDLTLSDYRTNFITVEQWWLFPMGTI